MNQLINISENNGNKAVSARDLHEFLEVGRDFSTWIKNRIEEYNFTENEDFEVFANSGENPQGGRPTIEYALSLDMAKELSMVEKTAKGKQARKYFIAVEKVAKATPVMTDKHLQHHTLLKLMKDNLRKGDMKKIATESGFSYDAVRNIFNASSKRPEVIKAIFEKALANKKNIGIDAQTMINQLNQ